MPVMPRPTMAGVLGMVRTIGVRSPKVLSKVAIEVPAAIDTISVVPLPSACSAGRAAPIICGLTAKSATAGAGGTPAFRCTPVEVSQSDGFGSKTQIADGGKPAFSQPAKSADPILPQPKSTSPSRATCSNAIEIPHLSGQRLGPTVGLGNGNLHRLGRAAVAPDGQLEGRVEPFRRQHRR